MTASDLEILCDEKLLDAKTLLDANRSATAYYLTGIAVECSIKVIAARRVKAETVPERDFGKDFYQHNLMKLVDFVGLRTSLESRLESDADFRNTWSVVKNWTADSRYTGTVSSAQASDFFLAATDSVSGIVPWIKRFW